MNLSGVPNNLLTQSNLSLNPTRVNNSSISNLNANNTKRASNAQAINNQMQFETPEDQAAREKREAELEQLKSRLYECVEEILKRQNEKAENLNFESFKVETASRKAVQELLQFFTLRDE